MNYRLTLLFSLFCLSSLLTWAQVPEETLLKREKRKDLTIKEWNTDAAGKIRWLDRITRYDELGRKIEEIEYATYGQKQRVTYAYDDQGRVNKEVVYDDHNRVTRIRKYEYDEEGYRKKQYNYLPNGKLYSVKDFQYIRQ